MREGKPFRKSGRQSRTFPHRLRTSLALQSQHTIPLTTSCAVAYTTVLS
jgi:hypothetical protein